MAIEIMTRNQRNGCSRRTFLKTTGVLGTVGAMAGFAGCTGIQQSGGGNSGGNGTGSGNDNSTKSGNSSVDTTNAEYTMRIATAYSIDSVVPLAQEILAKNVEQETKGRIKTELYPAGELSVGSKLASKVQGGSVEVGSLSLSNFSPYAPAVDTINLPYFASEYQSFVNLVTSDIWEQEVYNNVRENGFEPLFVWLSAPREIGIKTGEPTLTSGAVKGMKIRIPSSNLSSKAWNLAGANPTPVGWGETAQALEEGVVKAVHVSLPPLVAYGFQDLLNHAISIKMFMDSGIYAMSRAWFDKLPKDLQEMVKTASEKTFNQHLDRLEPALNESENVMKNSGVELHDPSESQLEKWRNTVGYQLSAWDDIKKRLAGDITTFEKLEKATEQNHGYTV